MQQIVSKFGGTSVSSRETWNNIAAIIKRHIKSGVQPVIVCSALSKASDKLEEAIRTAILDEHHSIQADISENYLQLAADLTCSASLIHVQLQQLGQWLAEIARLKAAPAKIRAQILSLGELMMTRLGHAFLQAQGINCLWFDAREALISTAMSVDDSINYLAARCFHEQNPNLAEKLTTCGSDAIITQGFIAANLAGDTVLLGRGGSDTSAALLAATLGAVSCEIWTDVPGIYSANPHLLPHARLLKQLDYDEAQEIASMGAKVLHPNCLPPVRAASIPMIVKFTRNPHHSGTRISHERDKHAPLIKSIQVKHNIILISIDTLSMWQQVGFLADVFATFKQHYFSVDLLSSSESNITLSLDNNVKLRDESELNALLDSLNHFGRAKIIESCSAVSLVGQNIRTILPQLGPTLEIFDGLQIYLLSLASNDLNLTFVVDTSKADKLCQQLHSLLIENNPQHFYYSKSWQEEFGPSIAANTAWWEVERGALLQLGACASPCYVYHQKTIEDQADKLLALHSINQCFYAIKANPHRDILQILFTKGIGFECVSAQELTYVLDLFPKIAKHQLLFTPNFAAKAEYAYAMSLGCHVTLDTLYPLEFWPELFSEKSVLLRIDPGVGTGHHKYVCTGGNESKFGITQDSLDKVIQLITMHNIKVVGLHAHSGSGILTPDLWEQTAKMLIDISVRFPDVSIINLGGGLGIVEKPGQSPLDLSSLDVSLSGIKSCYPSLSFWLEPGRFLVAESGVILAKVTQCKTKGSVRFIGIETGMNSLIRPALYGAYHEIVNLSKLNKEKAVFAHIVGPICESGDTLGYNRLLPDTQENDIMLIASAGAYGHCMSSSYNLRPPAQEIMFK